MRLAQDMCQLRYFAAQRSHASPWPPSNNILKVVFEIWCDLDVDGVVLFVVEERERIRWRCFDAYMCAVYCSDYVPQSSHGMRVPLNLYLFDSGVWKFDVTRVINWRQLWWTRGAHDSQRTGTHPICLLSPSERFPWPKIQKRWGPGCVV